MGKRRVGSPVDDDVPVDDVDDGVDDPDFDDDDGSVDDGFFDDGFFDEPDYDQFSDEELDELYQFGEIRSAQPRGRPVRKKPPPRTRPGLQDRGPAEPDIDEWDDNAEDIFDD